jgi:hypothetical protein
VFRIRSRSPLFEPVSIDRSEPARRASLKVVPLEFRVGGTGFSSEVGQQFPARGKKVRRSFVR